MPNKALPNIFTKIKVVGVGGAGGSAINRMIKSKIPLVKYVAVNTDVQALKTISGGPVRKIQIGRSLTNGAGTGMDPELGKTAIQRNIASVKEAVKGADIIFITAGLGGGTGSGAGPIVAEICRKTNALTIAVVTKPFAFEGARRMAIADEALKRFISRVDAIITISNDRIIRVIDRSTPILEAFNIADEALKQGVQSISDILFTPGLINLDFSDLKTILKNTGSVVLGIGRSSGEGRAVRAAKDALENPLIEGLSIKGATGALFIISGSSDLKLSEVNDIAETITEELDQGARIIFGAAIDESLKDKIKITLIATGFGRSVITDSPVSQVARSVDDKSIKETEGEEVQKHEKFSSISKKPSDKIRTYGTDINNNEEELKRREIEEIKLEEELEIPAFLRKKLE